MSTETMAQPTETTARELLDDLTPTELWLAEGEREEVEYERQRAAYFADREGDDDMADEDGDAPLGSSIEDFFAHLPEGAATEEATSAPWATTDPDEIRTLEGDDFAYVSEPAPKKARASTKQAKDGTTPARKKGGQRLASTVAEPAPKKVRAPKAVKEVAAPAPVLASAAPKAKKRRVRLNRTQKPVTLALVQEEADGPLRCCIYTSRNVATDALCALAGVPASGKYTDRLAAAQTVFIERGGSGTIRVVRPGEQFTI